MKHSRIDNGLLRSFAGLAIALLFWGCTKTIHDRRSRATITPESREYFGFVLNGKHYISEERTNNVRGTCVYSNAYDSAFLLRIESSHAAANCVSATIEIVLDSVNIKEGNRYEFGSVGQRKNYLTCFFITDCSKPGTLFTTRENSFGFITIKKYNPAKKVISATFSCIVTADDGKTTSQIADGYIDRHFTSM